MIEIAGHGWTVGVNPTLGGAILYARLDDRDVLRPAPAGCTDVLQAACFPLVPYANRIADGRFTVEGHAYHLPRNFGDHPHSLHGTGWQATWGLVSQSADSATLRYDHAPDLHWPWRFTAEQRIAVDAAGLEIALSLTNTGPTPMPAGVGLHPYFPASDTTRLAFTAQGVWLADATQLPTTREAAHHFGDWAEGASTHRTDLIDNAWDGWNGRATIGDSDGETTISTSDADIMHLYIPPGAGFLCVEPVSHLPDAINRGGMAVLHPGEAMRLAATIAHRAAPPTR